MKKSFGTLLLASAFLALLGSCSDCDELTEKITSTEYTVEHYKQALDGSTYTLEEKDTQKQCGTINTKTEAQSKNYEGFTAKEIEQQDIKSNGKTIVKIYYDRKQITVTFDFASGIDSEGNEKVTKTGLYGSELPAPEAARNGYFLASWEPNLPQVFPGEDSTYTAQWQLGEPKELAYELNGGSWNEDFTPRTLFSVEDEFALPDSSCLSRAGYEFAGWYETEELEGSAIDKIEKGTYEAKTLYAAWSEGTANYTVRHYFQNINADDYEENEAEVQTLQGRTNEETNATANEYKGFKPLTIEQQKVCADGSTVVKVYYDRKTYTVTFNSNGGNGESYTQDFIYKRPAAIETNRFARKGYSFIGWSTSEENNDVEYEENQDFAITENVDLYALWDSALNVSSTGNDTSGDGTKDNPFRTLSKVFAKIEEFNDESETYIINISGRINGVSIINITKAKELIIKGANENKEDEGFVDVLYGNLNNPTLTVSTKVPVTIENLQISNGNKGILNNGNLTINENVLICNNSGKGTGVGLQNSGTCIINGGKIIKNTSTGNDCGVHNNFDATLIMNSGEISGNATETYVGGISNKGTFIMNGGYIRDNESAQKMTGSNTINTGGVWQQGTFIMNGGEISGNKYSKPSNTSPGAGINLRKPMQIGGDSFISHDNEIYIPSLGTNSAESIKIILTSKLTHDSPVAKINPYKYVAGLKILDETEPGLIAGNNMKFELSDTAWYIDEAGCLARK